LDFPLKPGASVYIRVEDLSLDASGSKSSRCSRLRSTVTGSLFFLTRLKATLKKRSSVPFTAALRCNKV
jgi:hypothetical protein